MMKWSWLGAEGSGREGEAASARHHLLWPCSRLEEQPSQRVGFSWLLKLQQEPDQKLLLPQNTTALTGQPARLLMAPTFELRKLAPVWEHGKEGCPVK